MWAYKQSSGDVHNACLFSINMCKIWNYMIANPYHWCLGKFALKIDYKSGRLIKLKAS